MMQDLIALVPDIDLERTVGCLLTRPLKLQIRKIDFHIIRHRQRDSGCRHDAVRALRPHLRSFRNALVIFDKDGSSRRQELHENVQREVEHILSINGWKGRCKVVIIEPELEAWVWSGSINVPKALGWDGDYFSLRDWLQEKQLWSPKALKPSDPKKAVEVVLKKTHVPLTANLYAKLASRVTLKNCVDPALNEFRTTLQDWFPPY